MELLVSLNNKNIEDYLDYTNSFIIGLKDFSINYLEFNLEEIKELINKYPKINLFISLNRNFFNEDLKELENVLIRLNNLPIKGVLFYDIAVLSIIKRLNLNIPLCWHQTHMVTNYNTCNYYCNKGCEYAYLASEITLEEIKEIKNNSKIKLMSLVFGYPTVSSSKRKLLSNYFSYHNLPKEKSVYTINSQNSDNYFIEENNYGTSILYGNVLNGVKPFYELKETLDYAILREELIDHDIFIKILKIYKDVLFNKISYVDGEEMVYHLTNSHDTLFFYRKTIYKVKDEN